MLHYGKEAEHLTRASIRKLNQNTETPHILRVCVNGGPRPDFDALYWPEREPSLASAYNRAVKTFPDSIEAIAFVHNDCFVPLGWDKEMLEIVRQGDVAFPNVQDDPNSPVPTVPSVWPPSCCWMLSKALWDKVGGFNEAFRFCHFEDWDIWMRCIRSGATLRRANGVTVLHARGFTRALEAESANAALVANHKLYEQKHGKVGPCVI